MTQNESSKFWLQVLHRATKPWSQGLFMACCDGLTGFPEAIRCFLTPRCSCASFIGFRHALSDVAYKDSISHHTSEGSNEFRHALSDVAYKDRKAVAADLRLVYAASTETEAEGSLVAFAEKWDKQYPTIGKSWLTHWKRIIPFFAFPAEIRKAIYTTNAIESMNMTCRKVLKKVLKNHRAFPTDESALKVIYLAILNISN